MENLFDLVSKKDLKQALKNLEIQKQDKKGEKIKKEIKKYIKVKRKI